jgi:peptidoglycan L-alanyl-D-glutamate endopeptidase CwlK
MKLTREEALRGSAAPPEIVALQVLVEVPFWGFDGREHDGQVLVHRAVAGEVRDIFAEVARARFPIEKIFPVAFYGWSDDASMEDNNSSGFNFRAIVGGGRLSRHALGLAVDINPRLNPYVNGEVVLPTGAVYAPQVAGTITEGDAVVRAFLSRGWSWGGHWRTLHDPQHFEKYLPGEDASRQRS